jgi:glutaminyl-peptide cyclotransferase
VIPLLRRAVALAALAGLAGCRPAGEAPDAAFRPVDPTAFSGTSALREAVEFVNLGPKVAGTPGLERAATHLRDRLLALGVETRIAEFEDDTPGGRKTFRNVIARLPGGRPGLLIVGGHFDTKDLPDFLGANDGGSSTGLLLELARVLRDAKWSGPELWLVFFDGEEAAIRYSERDGLHGSRRLVEDLRRENRLAEVRAMVLFDMVGDRDLTITLPADTPPALARLVFAEADRQGVRRHFGFLGSPILDDHVPFQRAGVPAVDLIDFQFGSRPGWNDYWHTPADSVDKLDARSLEIVGRVGLGLLNRLAVAPP